MPTATNETAGASGTARAPDSAVPAPDFIPLTSSNPSPVHSSAAADHGLSSPIHPVIDHSTHPHIMDAVFHEGPYSARLALRATSRGYRDTIDAGLWRHVSLCPHPPVLRSFDGHAMPLLSALDGQSGARVVTDLGNRFSEDTCGDASGADQGDSPKPKGAGRTPPLPLALDFFTDDMAAPPLDVAPPGMAHPTQPTPHALPPRLSLPIDPFRPPFACPELRGALSRVSLVRAWGRHTRLPDVLRPSHRVLFGWDPPHRYTGFDPARGPARTPAPPPRRGTVRSEPGLHPFILTLNLDVGATRSVYDPWLDPPGTYDALRVIFTDRTRAPFARHSPADGAGLHAEQGEGEGAEDVGMEGGGGAGAGEEAECAFGADLASILNCLGRSTSWKTTFVNADVIPEHVLASRSFRGGIARRQGDPGVFGSLREALHVVRGAHWRFYYDAFEFLSLDEYRARVGEETFRLETDDGYMLPRARAYRAEGEWQETRG